MCHAPTVTTHPSNFSPGVSLTCSVESQPAVRSYRSVGQWYYVYVYCIMDISASRWQYNSSQGSFQIPNAKSMMSFMNYAVTGEGGGGEGEVLCWASNEVGGNYTNRYKSFSSTMQ